MSKQNVPALRLEGFSGEWEKTTLGELGAFRSGVGFPEREQGGTIGLPFYKVSDLSAPGNELQLQSANHYVTEGQIVRNHWTPVTAVPAILFAKVGAAVFLGRKRLVNNAFLLDNNLMAFSLNTESWDVQFADTYLKTVDLTQFTQSGALPSLNARHLAEAEAIIPPTLEEQQAIGAIFTNLDAAINQHTLKHKSLQQAKTALMQRMFPQEGQTVPELRLEGFSGEWEKTTLGELGAFRSGVGFPEREQGGTIGLPFYKVSDLSAPGNELQLQSANHYVTEGQIVRNHWTPVTAVPAILFAKVGAAVFLGRKRLVNNAFLLDNNLMAFSLNTESWDVQFADTYLKTVDLTQFTQSGALPSLNARHLAEAEAIIPPTLEEQQAIGAIFTKLDALIAAEAQYIESLKQAKTALLQRMFI